MLNDRSPTVSPYPQRLAPSAPSQQSLQPIPVGPNNNTKSYLLHKVRALLPYLEEILSQNDQRTNGVVGKLAHLKDNIDGIF